MNSDPQGSVFCSGLVRGYDSVDINDSALTINGITACGKVTSVVGTISLRKN